MKLLLKLAWRNIWRNKRRSILTIMAIFFAAFLTIIVVGMQDGTWEYSVHTSVSMMSGYLQIQREGYRDNRSLQLMFPFDEILETVLQDDPAICGYAPRIYADGLVTYDDNSYGAVIFGIDPELEPTVSRFHERIVEGRFISSAATDEIVIGERLMQNLQAAIGDTVVIIAQGADGSMGNMKYRIGGTVRFGAEEIDMMTVLMHIEETQELVVLYGNVNVVAIGVDDLRAIEGVKARLQHAIEREGKETLAVLRWEEVMPDLKQAMDFDKIGGWFLYVLLVIIVAFGILNTLMMSITERFREFGIILSIGMKQRMLVLLVVIETILLVFIGLIAANVAGYGINYYFYYNPIHLGGELAEVYAYYGIEPIIAWAKYFSINITTSLLILGVSFFVALFPVFKVLRLEPLKGIRYT
jgi:putative ABC transport system permease protein